MTHQDKNPTGFRIHYIHYMLFPLFTQSNPEMCCLDLAAFPLNLWKYVN